MKNGFETTEIHERPRSYTSIEAKVVIVLYDRAKAGCLLKKLRMKHRDEEVSLLPLRHEIDQVELLDPTEC